MYILITTLVLSVLWAPSIWAVSQTSGNFDWLVSTWLLHFGFIYTLMVLVVYMYLRRPNI